MSVLSENFVTISGRGEDCTASSCKPGIAKLSPSIASANNEVRLMIRPVILAALGLSVFCRFAGHGGRKEVRSRRHRHRNQDWPDGSL